MLGVKLFGGEKVAGGNVIIRQRGTKFWAGENVGMGKGPYALRALRTVKSRSSRASSVARMSP